MAILPRMSEATAAQLTRRDDIECFNGVCYRYSAWNDWGRWVALVVIVVAILIVAFLFSCINNRRRRRRGVAPMYGTGWVPGSHFKPNDQQNYYGNQPYYGGAAAPPYSAQPVHNQPTGTTFNSNDGYYGQQNHGNNQYAGQQSGIELQQPQHSYQPAANNVYPPKGDGVVR